MGYIYKKQKPEIVAFGQRDWDSLTPRARRAELMKGEDSKYIRIIKKLFGGAKGMLVPPSRITPKIGASEKGRAGRFGHSDYRGKN